VRRDEFILHIPGHPGHPCRPAIGSHHQGPKRTFISKSLFDHHSKQMALTHHAPCLAYKTKKPRISPGLFTADLGLTLDPYYVRGLKPFRTLGYFKRYLIAFNKGFKSVAADCGEMTKYIVATILLLQKSKTLAVVKPFYCTIYHVLTFS
jgi:hypothetical protein